MQAKKVLLFLLLFVYAAIANRLSAQVTTSSLTGTVKDSKGTTLAGATVRATHVPSGSVYGTVTLSDGHFVIPNMRVGGPYTITVTYIGYVSRTYDNIELQLGTPARLAVVLEDNSRSLSEVQVVYNRHAVISPEHEGPSFVISQQELSTLPTITRNINDFARLTPQAQSRNDPSDGSTMGITFGGQSNRYNQFTIDGANSTDIFGLAESGTNGGQAGINPIPFDAIEQVQVAMAPYDVTQGGYTGGGLNAVTRAGTNDFHGSVYGFSQDQRFVGKSADTRTAYGDFHDRVFGARLAGPIIKDKLFFFLNYEGERRASPIDLQPGSGGSNIDVSAAQELKDWLKNESMHPGWSYDPGAINGIQTSRRSDAIFARIDWNINEKNKLTIRHSFTTGTNFQISDSRTAMSFSNNGYDFNTTNNATVIELNSNISSKYSNLLRATYTATRDRRATPGAPFPAVTIKDGAVTYYLGTEFSSQANKLNQDIFTLTDNFTIYTGRHAITIGTHNEFYNTWNVFIQGLYGAYTYNSLADFYNDAAPNKYQHYFPTTEGSDAASSIHAAQFGLYTQDAFRVSDKVKITYGLRADMPVFFNKPAVNELFNQSEIARINNVATNKIPGAQILLSPRIGFNWDVKGDETTQLRGGAGLFTGRVPLVWLSNQYVGTGVALTRYTASADDLKNIHFTPHDPPSGPGSPKNEIDVTSRDFKFPRTFRANLAIDQQLPLGLIATAELVYTKTIQDILYTDLNLAPSLFNLKLGNTTRPFYGETIDPDFTNIILLHNTNKGYAYNLTIQLQRPFSKGWTASIAYNLGHSYGLNDGTSSVALSNYRFAYNINGLGNLDLARNNYDQGSHVVGYVSKRLAYGHFATTLGLVYTGQSGQVFSYVYYGDINGDDGTTATFVNTSNSADLIYLPTDASQFAPLYTTDKSGNVTGVKYTPEQEFEGFQQYMRSTRYTRDNQGGNTTRNGARMPWENHFDLKITEEYHINQDHRIELSVNIFNVSNLLNKKWGHAYYLSHQEAQPLDVAVPTAANHDPNHISTYTTFDPANPKYTFDPAYGLNQYTGKPWGYADFLSRWNMQLGLRYSF